MRLVNFGIVHMELVLFFYFVNTFCLFLAYTTAYWEKIFKGKLNTTLDVNFSNINLCKQSE